MIFRFKLTLLFMAIGLSPNLQAQQDLEQTELVAMIVACERLESDYAVYRDRGDAESFANTFTQDGEWGRSNGRVLKGRKAIGDYIRTLKTQQKAPEAKMQLTTTVQITPVDATTARGVSYAMVIGGPITEAGLPVTIDTFEVASESRSIYKLTAQGWKIAEREYTTLFVDPE